MGYKLIFFLFCVIFIRFKIELDTVFDHFSLNWVTTRASSRETKSQHSSKKLFSEFQEKQSNFIRYFTPKKVLFPNFKKSRRIVWNIFRLSVWNWDTLKQKSCKKVRFIMDFLCSRLLPFLQHFSGKLMCVNRVRFSPIFHLSYNFGQCLPTKRYRSLSL